MLSISRGGVAKNCSGMTRRSALQVGVLSALGISLADLNRLQAEGVAQRNNKSVILMWLDGGPSHLETYDPKPNAPSEYRGPWDAIPTNVPGISLSASLPLHARHADKMAVLRSVHHDNGDHFAGAHWMLTGRFGSTAVNLPQKYPSIGSFVSRIHGANAPGVPAYVGLPAAQSVYLFPGYQGAAYLGNAFNPFDVQPEQRYLPANYNADVIKPKCLQSFIDGGDTSRWTDRFGLLNQLDGLERTVDQSGMMQSMDRYRQEATTMILGGKARAAFDMSSVPKQDIDRYGVGPWGYYTLMARRLVEAGIAFVTVDMPHWDDHADIAGGHGYKLPKVDQAVSALLDDLSATGRLNDTLLIVMGEFSRTPRLNNGLVNVSTVPGRDHWGQAISVMLAGGGLRGGMVIGSTNSKGEHPVSRPLVPGDVLATVYKVLGIDTEISFNDHAGRPVPVLSEGTAIEELF